jgi:hypothetical protein
MPSIKSLLVAVVIAAFSSTMTSRALDMRFRPKFLHVAVADQPHYARWFVPPSPLRLEEGTVEESALPDTGLKPAYKIAGLLQAFALFSIASHDRVTHNLTIWTGSNVGPLLFLATVGATLAVNLPLGSSRVPTIDAPLNDASLNDERQS